MHTKLDTSIEMESLPIIMLISGSDMLHDSVDCFVCDFTAGLSPVEAGVEVYNNQRAPEPWSAFGSDIPIIQGQWYTYYITLH